jgi:hypothetical protein
MVTKLFGPILFVLALGACSAAASTVAPERPSAGPADSVQSQTEEAVSPPEVAITSSPPVLAASEVEARSLLSRLFRAGGLRIVNDRILRSGDLQVALDGFDPERAIGFEYVSVSEGDRPLGPAEERFLGQQGAILVLHGGTLDEIEERAKSFLKKALARVNPEG